MKRTIMITTLCLLLSGCGSMIQAVNAYGSIAVDNAKATNDTLVAGVEVTMCGLPLSAILRNPRIIPAVKALCPGASAAGLLDKPEAQP